MNETDTLPHVVMPGDRLLVRPTGHPQQTRAGLYLPPTVTEKEDIQRGRVVKAGPGFPIPALPDDDEPWKQKREEVRYVPLQVREGDQVLYLQRNTFEVEIDGEKFMIVPQAAVLLLIRDPLEGLGL